MLISDGLNQDNVVVHLFQKLFYQILLVPFHTKFYASEGAASQYKNQKNFINLHHH